MNLPRHGSDGSLIISVFSTSSYHGEDHSRTVSQRESHLCAPGGPGSNRTEDEKQRESPGEVHTLDKALSNWGRLLLLRITASFGLEKTTNVIRLDIRKKFFTQRVVTH